MHDLIEEKVNAMRVSDKTVLAVGIEDFRKQLEEIPIKVRFVRTAAKALRQLLTEKITLVVSRWDLSDMPNGKLLTDIIIARPSTPTIAIVTGGNFQQEIAASQAGVKIILTEDIADNYLGQVVCKLINQDSCCVAQPILSA